MRILIAEDDQVLADGLLRTLRSSGAVVSHVANGSEADTALLTSSEFDLLILDLGLPKMHGLEVLKRLRGRGDALPVLILTAADSIEERVQGLDYGACGVRAPYLLLWSPRIQCGRGGHVDALSVVASACAFFAATAHQGQGNRGRDTGKEEMGRTINLQAFR